MNNLVVFDIIQIDLFANKGFNNMKVLLINGSPKRNGNTFIALAKSQMPLPALDEPRQITNFIR